MDVPSMVVVSVRIAYRICRVHLEAYDAGKEWNPWFHPINQKHGVSRVALVGFETV